MHASLRAQMETRTMQRSFVLAAAAAATLLTAGAAHAGGVNWSIGISAPPVTAFVGEAPYYAAPSYYAAPVYPAAPYYPPRVYAPAPRVWLPPPPPLPRFWGGHGVGWRNDGWRNDGWRHDGRGNDGRRGNDDHRGRDDHGGWRR